MIEKNIAPLYSCNGREPEKLPDRIRLSDGSTRTDSSTFTKEELDSVGITGPYTKPEVEEYQNIIWDSENLKYVIIDTPDEYLYGLIRNQRNERLKECDWTQFPDTSLTENEVSEWKIYRQKLRDFPNIVVDPKTNNIPWPRIPFTTPDEK
jgi:hypothetical protein